MAKHKRSIKIGAYVAVPKAILKTPAWRAMLPGARLLWIELRGWLKNDGSNNGQIFRSCRDAAKAIGVEEGTIVRWSAALEHYGFIAKTTGGCLGVEGIGIAPHYRFTDLPYGTHAATRDFEKWSGELFVYTPRRPAREKQNPVSKIDTPRVENRHIAEVPGRAALCVQNRHIRKAPKRVENRYITSLPLPKSPSAKFGFMTRDLQRAASA
jgi:hypothetical protein